MTMCEDGGWSECNDAWHGRVSGEERGKVMKNEDSGKQKWVNVDKLSHGGKSLTHFEPGEIVRVKGRKFEVQRVQLEPPELRLVPVKKAR